MKIYHDNIIYSLQSAGGITSYWWALRQHFERKSEYRSFGWPNANILGGALQFEPEVGIRLPLKVVRYLPFLRRLTGPAIFHSSYYRVSLQADIANITTVHDFVYEKFRKGLLRRLHTLQKGFALRRSDGIICISENTKRDMLFYFPELDPDKIAVVYNGVSEEFFELDESFAKPEKMQCLPAENYILFVGQRSGYKNFPQVVNAVRKIPNLSLVVVGGGPLSRSERKLIQSLKHKFYHFLGVPNQHLNYIYNNALGLVYPSSYEGFGIPPIEAMKAGCPVIAGNHSSLVEVIGDAGILLDSPDEDSLVKAIGLLSKPEVRENLINRGRINAERFSWEKCAQETLRLYNAVVRKKFDVC